MQLPSALSGLSPQNVSLKKILYFLQKNAFSYDFSKKKAFFIFRKTELFYIFLNKVFLIFQEIKLPSSKNKKFHEGNFGAQKN